MINNAVGQPVQGADFFDRERERKQIWDRLATDSVLLLAPRRVGKTSFLYRLADEAPQHGLTPAYAIVSKNHSEIGFIRELWNVLIARDSAAARAISSVARGPLGRFFTKVKKIKLFGASLELSDSGQEQWAQVGEALFRALGKVDNRRWLLLVDELPIFVLSLLKQDPSGARARDFLNWFRALRTDATLGPRVRWVLAGSIGLDTVARTRNLGDTINDLFLLADFGAFDGPTAKALLADLSQSYELPLTAEVIDRIMERAGWLIPYHLQLLFAELRAHCGDHGVSPDAAAVDLAYERLMSPGKRAYFDYWEQRLHEELGPPLDAQALALLDAVAKDSRGVGADTLAGVLNAGIQDPTARRRRLLELLDVLRSDGYLVLEESRYRFRSPLLVDFWRRHRVS